MRSAPIGQSVLVRRSTRRALPSLLAAVSFVVWALLLAQSGCRAFQSSSPSLSTGHRIPGSPTSPILAFGPSGKKSTVPTAGNVGNYYGSTVSPLFQSDSAADSSLSLAGRGVRIELLEQFASSLDAARREAMKAAYDVAYRRVPLACSACWSVAKAFASSAWWALPLLLCAVPLYTLAAWQTLPTTPSWWKLVSVDHLWKSPDGPFVVAMFMLSNISYFMAGLYLLRKFPFVKSSTTESETGDNGISSGATTIKSAGRLASLSLLKPSMSSMTAGTPSRYTWLGIWTLLAGAVSTIFHAVQTYGEYSVAEGWCYLDHGIAISAILYFFRTCGMPGKSALALGAAGLVALSLPLKPGYAWLHSTWHLLSAGSAVLWALQGRAVRRARLEEALLARLSAPAADESSPSETSRKRS